MSIGRTRAVALMGLSGVCVDVEADVASGLPKFLVVGLPDRALGEATDRVRSAIVNSGFTMPPQRVTINLSPASLPKTGSGFDLAIAIAALCAGHADVPLSLETTVHIGELALDGRLRPTAGILPAVLGARRAGASTVIVPWANRTEAELVPDITVVAVASLAQAMQWHGLASDVPDVAPLGSTVVEPPDGQALDLADVIGQNHAIEALTYVAAGGHHVAMVGSPGAGKTMLANRLVGLLPDLTHDEALEVACLKSLASVNSIGELSVRPPFEAPHHTSSATALVGGGTGLIRPGAIARASHGVLFLDEAPEFHHNALEALRQPLESGNIVIQRTTVSANFPARFQLVLAANPCPCGKYGLKDMSCDCSPYLRRRYFGRLSGPLMDRVDVHLNLRPVNVAQLRDTHYPTQSTAAVRARVETARDAARERWSGHGYQKNALVPGALLRSSRWRLPPPVSRQLDHALEKNMLSMRGYDRTLRLAWSIADVEGAITPTSDHVGVAFLMRQGAIE